MDGDTSWARVAIPHQDRSDSRPPPFIFQDVRAAPMRVLQWAMKITQHRWRLLPSGSRASRSFAQLGIKRGVDVSSRLSSKSSVVAGARQPQARARKRFARPFPLICELLCEPAARSGFDAKSAAYARGARPYGRFGNLLRGLGAMDLRVRDEQSPSSRSQRQGPMRGDARRRPKTCSI